MITVRTNVRESNILDMVLANRWDAMWQTNVMSGVHLSRARAD